MRRIMLLVTVGLVMAAMMVTMAAPAIAYHGGPGPTHRPCNLQPGTHVSNVSFVNAPPGPVTLTHSCAPIGPPS
jgi:hypothetical protein